MQADPQSFTRRACLTTLAAGVCRAVDPPLLAEWRRIASETDGTVGASALHLGSRRRVSLNGSERFPLASVCKLPIAMNILAMAGEGKLSLASEIEIPVYDVVPGTSEIAERWPKQKSFPLDQVLELMIAKSDNTAVQTLFRVGGGEAGMAARLRQWQIEGVRVDRDERQCALDAYGITNFPGPTQWRPGMPASLMSKVPTQQRLRALRAFAADPRDTATPDGAIQLLDRLFHGDLLAANLTARLIQMMKATTTGPGRIKGLLPPATVVAHKTGTAWTAAGFNAATNDVGVITLSRGAGQLAIAVFVKGSTRPEAGRERIIAKIARAAFDSYSRA